MIPLDSSPRTCLEDWPEKERHRLPIAHLGYNRRENLPPADLQAISHQSCPQGSETEEVLQVKRFVRIVHTERGRRARDGNGGHFRRHWLGSGNKSRSCRKSSVEQNERRRLDEKLAKGTRQTRSCLEEETPTGTGANRGQVF